MNMNKNITTYYDIILNSLRDLHDLLLQDYQPGTWESSLLYKKVYLFAFFAYDFDFYIEYLTMDLNISTYMLAIKTYNAFYMNYCGLRKTSVDITEMEILLNECYYLLTTYPIQFEEFPSHYVFDFIEDIKNMI
jgi:hypothetical protein